MFQNQHDAWRIGYGSAVGRHQGIFGERCGDIYPGNNPQPDKRKLLLYGFPGKKAAGLADAVRRAEIVRQNRNWRNIMVRATLAFAFLIGIVLLQIFLSRTERKWPGLILPIISFLFGFLYPFNMSAGTLIWQVFFVWLLGNIPTIIFLAIYFACRPKQKQTAGE